MKDLKFTLSFDERGRVIYQPGDIVGVRGGKGPIPWLSYHAVVPQTPLFHFLLIGYPINDLIGWPKNGGDYTILESIGKGPALGRLSWYKDREYVVFRVNHEDGESLGERAWRLASKYGRHRYDWKLYAKIFAWALGYWLKEIATLHIPPRPVYPMEIPYKTDQDFICIELVFEAWKQVGFRIREHGHAPVPAEVILAERRGDLAVIDNHDGNPANWRTQKSPIYTAAQEIARKHDQEAARKRPGSAIWPKGQLSMGTVSQTRGDMANLEATPAIVDGRLQSVGLTPKPGPDIIGRQVGQKRNRAHIFRQPYGYPIRLCDWVAVDVETIERIGEAQGITGPAEASALVQALDWAETLKNAVICKHCRALVKGERGPLMGGPGGYA